MMNKHSLACTLIHGAIAHSLALVMTTSQCIVALIACFVPSEAPVLQSGRVDDLSSSLRGPTRDRFQTQCFFPSFGSVIDHSLSKRHIFWSGRLEVLKIMSTKWNR